MSSNLRDFKEIYKKEKDEGNEGDFYSEVALDHFLNPRNVGVIKDADAFARVGDPSCGDFLELYLKLDPKGETVVDVKFLVFGCGGAISSTSILTEMVKGKDFVYCLSLSDDDVIEALGDLPEGKGHCSLMSVTALKAALSEYIMRSYAISEGIVKDEEEFREKFLMDRKSFEGTDDLDEKGYKKDETDSDS